jgi:hypothetical protein
MEIPDSCSLQFREARASFKTEPHGARKLSQLLAIMLHFCPLRKKRGSSFTSCSCRDCLFLSRLSWVPGDLRALAAKEPACTPSVPSRAPPPLPSKLSRLRIHGRGGTVSRGSSNSSTASSNAKSSSTFSQLMSSQSLPREWGLFSITRIMETRISFWHKKRNLHSWKEIS